MGLNIPPGTPDRGPVLEGFLVVLIVVTTFMILIRILSKIYTQQRWWWDDWLILASWVAWITVISLILAWKSIGLGLHVDFIAAQNQHYIVKGTKYFRAAIFFFDSSITLPKLSALFFYARIFSTSNRLFRIQLWAIGVLVCLWLVSAWIVTVWQCKGSRGDENLTIPGQCINAFAWYTATAASSVALDIWILVIPIPLIWGLNASLKQRIYLLIAFFCSYSVILVSIGRLVATTQILPDVEKDVTWLMPPYMYWAGLEGSLSIISVTIPNFIALIKALWRPKSSPGTHGSHKSLGKEFDPNYDPFAFDTEIGAYEECKSPIRDSMLSLRDML